MDVHLADATVTSIPGAAVTDVPGAGVTDVPGATVTDVPKATVTSPAAGTGAMEHHFACTAVLTEAACPTSGERGAESGERPWLGAAKGERMEMAVING